MSEADKATKFEAQYTPEAKMPEERCRLCRYFIENLSAFGNSGCRLVRGDIRPEAWCKFFDRAKD